LEYVWVGVFPDWSIPGLEYSRIGVFPGWSIPGLEFFREYPEILLSAWLTFFTHVLTCRPESAAAPLHYASSGYHIHCVSEEGCGEQDEGGRHGVSFEIPTTNRQQSTDNNNSVLYRTTSNILI
tara:strand:- start:1092 stop:1463 length:372 start_codon:yes stop_codon:yes gene_type:complete